ncbi:hypothetical protein PIIN_05135 [Serendipita indica DSM 11827]|uniref:Uncharacterized protein n=1 Tax=Serendipita indica (strain DSM 11827) TaxID=1109443 RepID=G4TIR5_SERID|nr:hypothetical protein PIIN_05135 [Serendipita indica DSM 11827]
MSQHRVVHQNLPDNDRDESAGAAATGAQENASQPRVIQQTLPENDRDETFVVTTESPNSFAQSSLFVLVILLTAILVPLVLLFIIIVNLSGSIIASILFEVLGHAVLRALGVDGFNNRLKHSVKVGAVGGAIVAIPFNIFYAFLEYLIAPTVVSVTDESEAEPLLPPERQSSFGQVTKSFNESLKGTRRNPINQRLYLQQRETGEAPSRWRVFFALLGDFLSGPALGALSGAVGSFVLEKAGHEVMDVAHSVQAGALGGFILGPLAAALFSTMFAVAIAVFISRNPST